MGEQVGYVNDWSHPSRVSELSAYSSFVGGVPHNSLPLSSIPTCGACGKQLYLVLQLYAPTDRERHLLIFGCNSSACIGVPGSWAAVRTQGAKIPEPAVADARPPAAGEPSSWGFGGSEDAGWGAASDWEAAANDADAGTALARLTAQAATLSMSPAPADAAPAQPVHRAPARRAPRQSRADDDRLQFACFAVETAYGEPRCDASDSESDSDEGDDGRLGGRRETMTASATSRPQRVSADWQHAQRLLEEYHAREALEQNSSAGQEDSLAQPPSAEAGDSASDDDAAHSEGEPDQRGRAGDRGVARGDGGGEKYEKTPAKQRYLIRFQRRVSLIPTQVVRYVWDAPSDVLWPVPPNARPRAPPLCVCGAQRKLELQVLPTVLFGLKVDDAPGGGMDFLSLLVYSCETSCDSSQQEVVVALPPS